MKKICAIILFLAVTLFSQDQITLAVSDFTGRGIAKYEVEAITDKIRDEMHNSDLFQVMARSEMGLIMQEMEFQTSGACSDAACAVEVGQILGVQSIVTGSIGKVGSIFYITLKMIDIETSEISYSISDEFECKIEDLLTTHAGMIVHDLESQVASATQGVIIITTEPENAELTLNGASQGTVPFQSGHLSPGEYTIILSQNSFESIEETVSLTAGETLALEYSLEYTQAYTDSLFGAGEALSKRKQTIRRIVFGSLSAVSFGMGIYFNSEVDSYYNELIAAREAYDNAGGGDDFESLGKAVTNAQGDVDTYSLMRNISYGSAGGFAIGLGLSIPF